MLRLFHTFATARRLLALWVLLSVLGYGTAWAMDLHELPLQGHDAEHALAIGDGEGLGTVAGNHDDATGHADGPACDHCCHGLSHLLGLSSELPSAEAVRAAAVFPAFHRGFASRAPLPDRRPPRV